MEEASCSDVSSEECEPLSAIPAWWSGFLFHVLNPRQLSMYLYLTMLSNGEGVCHPTIDQIRKDLGLLSDTMVFDALAVLEETGFIVRTRRVFPDSRSKRNVYQRTTCEYTVLRLLETERIDGCLRPVSSNDAPAAQEARELVEAGLESLLGSSFDEYARADDDSKKIVLMHILNRQLQGRPRGIYQ